MVEQLLPAAGDCMYVQAEEIAQPGVTAVTQSQGLKTGKQSALLFVQQTIKEEDRGLEFIGRQLERFGADRQRNGLRAAADQSHSG